MSTLSHEELQVRRDYVVKRSTKYQLGIVFKQALLTSPTLQRA